MAWLKSRAAAAPGFLAAGFFAARFFAAGFFARDAFGALLLEVFRFAVFISDSLPFPSRDGTGSSRPPRRGVWSARCGGRPVPNPGTGPHIARDRQWFSGRRIFRTAPESERQNR